MIVANDEEQSFTSERGETPPLSFPVHRWVKGLRLE